MRKGLGRGARKWEGREESEEGEEGRGVEDGRGSKDAGLWLCCVGFEDEEMGSRNEAAVRILTLLLAGRYSRVNNESACTRTTSRTRCRSRKEGQRWLRRYCCLKGP